MRGQRRGLWWRVMLAVLLVTLATALVFGEFYWTIYDLVPYDPETGAHPEFISTPVSALSEPISKHTWRILPGLTEMLLGSAAGIAFFVLLGGRRSCARAETLCGYCGGVLRGLTEAKCPKCAQAL